MALIGNNHITVGAAALGISAVAAHHLSEGAVDPIIIAMAKFEGMKGIAFGAGGGAAVALVTRASLSELIGRMVVGGLLAAVAAPAVAEHVLHVPLTSTAYPIVCCSIGVLGFQIVKQAIDDPSSIPIIGKFLSQVSSEHDKIVAKKVLGQNEQDQPPMAASVAVGGGYQPRVIWSSQVTPAPAINAPLQVPPPRRVPLA